MSSARNHAKRSHRSEHFKKAAIGSSTRRMYIRQTQRPKRIHFFKALAERFRRTKDIAS